MILLFAACAAPDWAIVADEVAGGVMLGAHVSGDVGWIVGGDLDGRVGTTGAVWRLEDGALTSELDAADRTLWWIHGRGDAWWAVGAEGRIVYQDGDLRVDESVPTSATLYGVWAGPDDVVAVGGHVFGDGTGEIWRRDADGWRLDATTPGVLFKIWDDTIVGADQALRRDGADWTLIPHPSGSRMLTVTGRGDERFAVGGAAQAALFGGTRDRLDPLDVDPRCAFSPLNGAWTAPGESLWIAGNFGTIAEWDGRAWACPDAPLTDRHFHATFRLNDEQYFIGGNLLDLDGHSGTIARFGTSKPVAVR